MTKEKLLELLKKEASFIDEKTLSERYNALILDIEKGGIISPAQKLLKYNLETIIELKNKILDKNENELIDDENMEILKSSIDNYMDKYAGGENAYKMFIRIIAVYLTYIVKKPLHLEGMFNAAGKTLYKKGKVMCPIRKHEINKHGTLCRFCVSAS
jgi:uncharacterized protein (UPF0305 family)